MDVACKSRSAQLYIIHLLNHFPECENWCHGLRTALASHEDGVQVCQSFCLLGGLLISFCRDPSQHEKLQDDIEYQTSSLYSTARLWDDGIIKPTDTRDVVGLGLALAARQRGPVGTLGGARSTTWDGNGNGFGVFRM